MQHTALYSSVSTVEVQILNRFIHSIVKHHYKITKMWQYIMPCIEITCSYSYDWANGTLEYPLSIWLTQLMC